MAGRVMGDELREFGVRRHPVEMNVSCRPDMVQTRDEVASDR